MSSTARGGKRSEADFYETPSAATRLILPHLRWEGVSSVIDPCAGRGAILQVVHAEHPDVVCGGIELDLERTRACRALGFQCNHGDALEEGMWAIPPPDLGVTNFPFSLATEMCLRALKEIRPGGELAVLMRLAVLAGKKRRSFWRNHPADVYVLERRPSYAKTSCWDVVMGALNAAGKKTKKRVEGPFLSPGDADRALAALRADPRFANTKLAVRKKTSSTDSSEYAWFVFGPGRGHRWTRLEQGQPTALLPRLASDTIAA